MPTPRASAFLARFLDHRPVGHGIGKRHAQLDDVGPGRNHAVHQLGRDVRKREAGGDVRDERLAAGTSQGIEFGGKAAQPEQVVTAVNGPTLMVKYKDGEKTIIVPPDAPVVTFAPGDKADLKPGTKIFILAAKKLPDGTLQAARVNYGKDGLPPM